MYNILKFLSYFSLISFFMSFNVCYPLPPEAIAKGFVNLKDIDSTIVISPRYYSSENFLGRRVPGYEDPVILMTSQAAQALKKVQEAVIKDGYSLVVYDAYRPQQAVDEFVRWNSDLQDQFKKRCYYPRIGKERLFELGYIAERSGHTRGNTVDLTLIEKDHEMQSIKERARTLLDGYTITFLDDGTVDMGSSFDLFDEASHGENALIEEYFKEKRRYLKKVMEKEGFLPYKNEWWHFRYGEEPYPDNNKNNYFNFPATL